LDQEVDLLARALRERVPQVGGTEMVGDGLEPVVGLLTHPTSLACVTSIKTRSGSTSHRQRLEAPAKHVDHLRGFAHDGVGGELQHVEAHRLELVASLGVALELERRAMEAM